MRTSAALPPSPSTTRFTAPSVLAITAILGCSSTSPTPPAPPPSTPSTPHASAGTTPAPGPTTMPTPPPAAPAAAPTASAPAASSAGTDFAAEVRALYRISACGGADIALPADVDAKIVAEHCKDMARRYKAYHRAWADRAGTFIAALRPADLPARVVYPFGGGDLTSALVVFPDAAEITTVSLEAAGDVRVAFGRLPRADLKHELSTVGHDIGRLFQSAHSTTKSLQTDSHSKLPGQLVFTLAALAVHGLEPVSLRYFDLEDDGRVRYLTPADLDRAAEAIDETRGPRIGGKHRRWKEQRSPFANVEIGFRAPGGPVRTFRHILANLDDDHLKADGRVVAHLAAKGKVSAMTKAASFLLWWDDFSIFREYLTSHIAWMISDASGIPPAYADKAGFEQITYGEFDGPYFIQDPRGVRHEMVKMWKTQPRRPLPFRFGYPSAEKNNHLMITRPRAK